MDRIKREGLAGMKVAVTGSLVQRGEMTRGQVETLLKKFGAAMASGVTSKTSLLVVGEKPGASKMEEAWLKGVRMLNEAEFWELVGEVEGREKAS